MLYSNNPRQDLFQFSFPPTMFNAALAAKYNRLLAQYPTVMGTIDEIVNEAIQTFDFPAFEYEPLTQQIQEDPRTRSVRPNYQRGNENVQNLTQKTFTISLRHCEGYLTYFYLLEIFFAAYSQKNNDKYLGTFPLQTKLSTGEIISTINLKNVLFTGISGLPLSFSNVDASFGTFDLTFYYSTFDTIVTIPELKLSK